MKVIHMISSLSPGGKERQLIELCKGLTSRKIDYEVIVLNNKIGLDITSISSRITIIKNGKSSKLKNLQKIIQYCKKSDPSILQAWDAISAVYLFPVSKILNVPFVNFSIQYAKKIQPFSMLWIQAKISFPFSDKIIANSFAGLRAHGLKANKKNISIYNGYDLNRSKLLDSDKDAYSKYNLTTPHIIGMIGNFLDAKDHFTFIKAALKILSKRKDITFVCIGNGKKLPLIKSLIPLELDSHFRFLEKITHVEPIVNTFTVGCLICNTKGHAEGISNAIIEYMAMAKPVVATDSGGCKEIVEDSVTGFIIPPFDENALVDKLNLLINDKSLSVRMGQLGKERIKSTFSLDLMTESFLSIYNELKLSND